MQSFFERMKNVDLGKWFASWPTSRKGGMIGVFICLFLFAIFFGMAMMTQGSDNSIARVVMTLMIFTVHAWLVSAAFFFQDGFMCDKVGECSLRIGGRCNEVRFIPLEPCAHITRTIGIWSFILGLFIVYYFIGARIAISLEKRKQKLIANR